MKILALEAYYGGSHKAFLDGLIEKSRHQWTLLTLPPYKWKWRMRHSAIYFTDLLRSKKYKDKHWDILFCSDMLNLAEFKGMADEKIKKLKTIIYFHENQLTYPLRAEDKRDYQYVLTNMNSAVAADEVWFNSKFHEAEFLTALKDFLKKMPDYQPYEQIKKIKNKSKVVHPGIREFETFKQAEGKKVKTILWAARWEHDKNPEDFFATLSELKKRGYDFKLNVIGENFRDRPEAFDKAKKEFKEYITRWGYQKNRKEYEKTLKESDVIVSTAVHEFFGIAVLEAMARGCYPLLPERLAYPEITDIKNNPEFFYDGTVKSLAKKLERLIDDKDQILEEGKQKAEERTQEFFWSKQVKKIDEAIENINS